MPREKRLLNAKTGELKVIPFTPEEEIEADQREAAMADKLALESAPDYRVDKAFQPTDKDRLIFNAFFELTNRIQVLEGKQPITKQQLLKWFENQLP